MLDLPFTIKSVPYTVLYTALQIDSEKQRRPPSPSMRRMIYNQAIHLPACRIKTSCRYRGGGGGDEKTLTGLCPGHHAFRLPSTGTASSSSSPLVQSFAQPTGFVYWIAYSLLDSLQVSSFDQPTGLVFRLAYRFFRLAYRFSLSNCPGLVFLLAYKFSLSNSLHVYSFDQPTHCTQFIFLTSLHDQSLNQSTGLFF